MKHSILLLLTLLFAFPLSLYAEPLTLKDAVNRAVAKNPDLLEARTSVAIAAKGVEAASARHYPRLSFEASIAQRQDPVAYIPAQSVKIPAHFSDGYGSLGPVLTLPLYQGGQTVNSVRLGELRHRLQEDSATLTKNEIIANTVATYNKILQLKALADASRRSVSALDEQQKNAELLFKVGRIARVDLLKVEVQKNNEDQRLLALNEGIKNAEYALLTLMGETLGADFIELELKDTLLTSDFQADFSAALLMAQKNPKLLIAAKSVDDAELNQKIVFGKFLPTLNAVAGYQEQFGFNPSFSDGVWYLGASLSMPLFDKGNYTDLARERLQKERALQKLKSLENQTRLDLKVAQGSIIESRKRIATTALALEQSGESFRIESEKYKAGSGTMAELLLVQSAQAVAESNYSQALYDYNSALLQWHRASGDMEVYLK